MREEYLPTRLHLHAGKDIPPIVLYRLHGLESEHSWAYGPSASEQGTLRIAGLDVPIVRIKKD